MPLRKAHRFVLKCDYGPGSLSHPSEIWPDWLNMFMVTAVRHLEFTTIQRRLHPRTKFGIISCCVLTADVLIRD